MISFASRRSDRLVGAALSVAVQAILIGLLIFPHSPPPSVVKAARELIFVLPRLQKSQPPPATPARSHAPSLAPSVSPPVQPAPPTALAPAPPAPSQEQLRGLGQSLFGCAPEAWSSLTAEQRTHCSRPGEGIAVQEAPDLMHPTDHVKDEAYWREKFAEDHWMPGPCPVGREVALCLMAQYLAEQKRAQDARLELDRQKAAALQPSKPLLPERIGVHPQ